MTTGNKTLNHRYNELVTQPNCSFPVSYYQIVVNGLGRWSSRQWTGGDSPRVAAETRTLINFSYPVYSRNGTLKYTRTKTVWNPSKKAKPMRPKRQNAFTSNYSYTADLLETSWVRCKPTPDPWYWRALTSSTNGRGMYGYFPIGSDELLAVRGKLRARVGASFNAAVTLGEARESLRTITQSATRIYKAYKAARKGNWTSAANTLVGANGKTRRFTDRRNFANNWLEIRYGWLPLLRDIKSAAEHLAYLQNRPVTMKHRVKSSLTTSGWVNSINGSCISRLQVIANITSVNEFKLAGLADPASVAWELTPFSFVADWFIPVGSYLEGQAIGSAITALYVNTQSHKRQAWSFQPNDPLKMWSSNFDHLQGQVVRTISSSLPQLKPPAPANLMDVADWKKAVTAVSLIIQRMR